MVEVEQSSRSTYAFLVSENDLQHEPPCTGLSVRSTATRLPTGGVQFEKPFPITLIK